MNIGIKMFSLFIIEVVFCIMSYCAKAQSDYSLKKYTTADGLANNSVYSICQDKTGFLWMATFEGVSRFDGYEFKNYFANPDQDSISLPYYLVDKLVIDRHNNLFAFCSNKPISIYNRTLDRFEKLSINGKLNVVLYDIMIDQADNAWLLGKNELYRTNNIFGTFKIIKVLDEINRPFTLNTLTSITVDNKGTAWLFRKSLEGYSIYKGSLISDSCIRMTHICDLNFKRLKSFMLRNLDKFEIYQSMSGKTWLFSSSGLFLFNIRQNRFIENITKLDLEEFSGKDYFEWIDERTGINIINSKTRTYITVPPEPGIFFETSYIDQNKTIWSGTLSKSSDNIGLNRYIRIPDYFKYYLDIKNENFASIQVCPILKDIHGDIWAGIKNSDIIYRIKPNKEITKVNCQGYKLQDMDLLPSSIVQDSSGILISGTENRLVFYDYKSGGTKNLLTKYVSNNFQQSPGNIHTIIKDNNDLVLNGTKGIYRYNPLTGRSRLYYLFDNKLFGATFISDGRNGFWIGFNSAIVVHLNTNLQQDAYYRFGNRQDIVEHLCIGDHNDLWAAFQGGGLGHLNTKTGKTEIFTTSNGLSNNTVYDIIKDKTGRLWISTDQGISSFDPNTRQFRNFEKEDGLLFEKFDSESGFMSPDGEIFFGGVGGIVSFYPSDIIKIKETVYPLVITEFDVSGAPRYFSRPLNETDSLTLEKGDNNFQVSFSYLDFKNAQKIKYHYRLIGVTDKWRETDQKNRKIAFFNLLPGNYLLEVEAADKNGNWVSKASMNIFIPYRIYETLWFKIIIAAIVLLLITGIVVIYNKQIRIKARQEWEELKLEALRNQMNPHFIFNSLNSINYFISNSDKLSANSYIADFSRLIRSFLTNLSADFVPLDLELQTMQDYLSLENLRFKDKFTYSFSKVNLEDSSIYFVFPGIIQPFIENAIWHGIRGLEGRIGHIEIQVIKVSPELIQCIIEDDGLGRNLSMKNKSDLPGKKSRGIGIVTERLQLYNSQKKTNYKVNIEDLNPGKEETGTRVVVDLPIKT